MVRAELATVRQAAAESRLLIFAGAGISMLPPSYLPDWKGFNRALLEEIKASALSVAALPERAGAAIRRLDIDLLPVEAFSDTIVRSLAADDYFPLLKILDSDYPNTHHSAIAELVRRGICRAIVTTNFDRRKNAWRNGGGDDGGARFYFDFSIRPTRMAVN